MLTRPETSNIHTYESPSLPSESHLQRSTRQTTFHWGRTDFFNDDFGRLTGIEPLFRGVRVAVLDQVFITCNNDKSFNHGITGKMTYPLYGEPTEVSIHEVQIYSFCMIFQSVLIWQCMVPFAFQVLTAYEFSFVDFLPKFLVYSKYPII